MSTPSERHLAQELSRLSQRLDRLEQGSRPTQLGHSSIENDNVRTYDSAGSVRQVTGKQSDGTFAVTYENGTTPPTPSDAVVSARQLALVAYWDGTFPSTATRRKDIQRVDVHASETSGYTPDGTTLVGSLVAEGAISFTTNQVPHYVVLVAVTNADVASTPSNEVESTPLPVSDLAATNTILDGTTLVRDAIQSGNYSAGSSGWIIQSSGDAEFNNAALRGDVTIEDPDSGAQIQLTSGNEWPYIGYHSPDGTLQGWHTLDVSPAGVYHIWWFLDGTTTFVILDDLGRWWLSEDVNGGVMFDPADGTLKRWLWDGVDYVDSFAVQDWIQLTLQNGWTHRSGFAVPAYKMMLDGTVMLQGEAEGGTPTSGTVIASLPAEYTPSESRSFAVTITNEASGEVGRIIVNSNGDLQLFGSSSSTDVLALDGIRFSVV